MLLNIHRVDYYGAVVLAVLVMVDIAAGVDDYRYWDGLSIFHLAYVAGDDDYDNPEDDVRGEDMSH